MATRRKAWHRTPDLILHQDWSDSTVATLARLSAYLNTRWARSGLSSREAGEAVLSRKDLFAITNKERVSSAMRVLHTCGDELAVLSAVDDPWNDGETTDKLDFSVSRSGTKVTVRWRNYSDFQQYPDEQKPRKRPLPSASASSSASSSKKERKMPDKPATRPRPKGVPFPPEGLSIEDRAELDLWAFARDFEPPEVDAYIERARTWSKGNGKDKVSWVATIQNWMIGDRKKDREPPPSRPGAHQNPREDRRVTETRKTLSALAQGDIFRGRE